MDSIRRGGPGPRALRLFAFALATAALAGCASKGSVAGRVQPPVPDAVVQATPVRPGKPRQARPDTMRVAHRDGRFDPGVINVPAGGVLEIRNRDKVWHSAFCLHSKARFQLGRARPGEKRRVSISNPGRYEVFCEFHPAEVLYVVVPDSPWSTCTTNDGKFLLGDLPKGEYILEAWHPKLGTTRQKVTIPTKEEVRLRFKG